MVDFSLNAKARNDLGKGASRRLRRNADLVPAIVYGGDKAPQNIALEARELKKALENEAFYSHVIKLSIDGKKEDVLLKALQRHPAKPLIMHQLTSSLARVSTNKMTSPAPPAVCQS